MTKKTPEELLKMLLEMESEVDDSKITSKKGKLKGAPANIAGKIYRDIFGIRREGNIYTNPNAVILNTLKNGKHDEWNLITIGTKPYKSTRGHFIRRAKIRIEFQCCYDGKSMNDPIQLDVELEDVYDNRTEAYKNNNLHNWLYQAFRESASNISEEECNDWNEQYLPCENSRKLLEILRDATEGYEGINEEVVKEQIRLYEEKRDQELIKRQKKQESERQKREAKLKKEREKAKERPTQEIEIPVTIEEVPTTITIKKDLTTMDIVQISRLQKSIAKLEKVRQEQEAFINLYNERIKSERLDLLLSSTKQRDNWIDEVNRTKRKIEKQQEAIERIKMGG